MINLDVLKQRFADARLQSRHALDKAAEKRAISGHCFEVETFEMDASAAAEEAQATLGLLSEIERRSGDIDRCERDTGREFDCLGPLPAACADCRGIFQYVPDHKCSSAKVKVRRAPTRPFEIVFHEPSTVAGEMSDHKGKIL